MFAAFTALMIALIALVLAVVLPALTIAWYRNVCTDNALWVRRFGFQGLFPSEPAKPAAPKRAPSTIIGQPAPRVLPAHTIKVGG